jgi:hypothetical protein
MLDRDSIARFLTELAAELDAHGVRGEMFIVGGAAMALAYNTRRATSDIGAVFEPKMVVYEAAARVARSHPDELDEDWLNDAVKGLLPGSDANATVVFDHPGLVVRVASPGYLFAMKVAASRVERDVDDIVALFQMCGFNSVDEALDHVTTIYPALTLEPRAQFLLEEIASTTTPEPPPPPPETR